MHSCRGWVIGVHRAVAAAAEGGEFEMRVGGCAVGGQLLAAMVGAQLLAEKIKRGEQRTTYAQGTLNLLRTWI